MTQDIPTIRSDQQVTQGIKLGQMRYVLGWSLAFCVAAGALLWFFH